MAMYPYDSTEPGDLSFQAGEMVVVSKKDGDWWTGTIGSRTGVFPSNYVQKADLQYEAAADSEVEAATAAAAAASAAASAAATTTASASVSSDSAFGGQTSTRPSTAPIDTDFEVHQLALALFATIFKARVLCSFLCLIFASPMLAAYLAQLLQLPAVPHHHPMPR